MSGATYHAPEATKIMEKMPGTYKQVERMGDSAWEKLQAFNDDAQISLINRHIVKGMSIENRRRAEQVKAGTYRVLADT